jgi:carboxymethylenebutenolidase
MARKTAHDFDQDLLILFDAYVHGAIDRRLFLERAAKYAVGGVTAAMLLDQLSPSFAASRVVATDDARIAAEHLEYDSPKGSGRMRGYFVRPKAATGKLPGILVIHENRGLNPHIEDVARRLALANFAAFAPDALFPLGGYPGDEDKARELFPKLDREKTREDFVAAAGWLKARPECTGRIGAVGFCWGGGMVGYLATRLGSDLAAGVPFYGASPDSEDVPKIKCPLLVHSAEVDERINASWPEFERALKAANVPYERFLYAGTQHGFNNDTTPRYDAAAAKLAWERTVAFFDKHVRGAGPAAAPGGNVVEGVGTVAFISLEGGFYAIRSETGVTYDPRSLPEAFRSDGLRVRFKVRILPDAIGFHQVGPIVEVLDIERRE